MSTPISTALETPVYCSGATAAHSDFISVVSDNLTAVASPATLASCSGKTALDLGFDVAGGRFEKMIIYTGACFAGAALMVTMGWGVEVRRRKAVGEERRD